MGLAIRAGTEIDCNAGYYAAYGQQAIDQGFMTEADVDRALQRQFYTLVLTGYFDSPDSQPYRQYGPELINTKQSQRLAREAAVKSFVLLKNEAQLLPLTLQTTRPTRIALIGPNAAATTTLQGSYGTKPAVTLSRVRCAARARPSLSVCAPDVSVLQPVRPRTSCRCWPPSSPLRLLAR